MNQPSLQQEMSTYADVKARCARIVTRLEAIATDPNATPADPRDLFIRLELLSHEPRGATFRVREWLVADRQRRGPAVNAYHVVFALAACTSKAPRWPEPALCELS